MLGRVMEIKCDEPGCDKRAYRETEGWGEIPAAEIQSFVMGCQSAGWETVPAGAGELGAHYCPWHNSRCYRRPVAAAGA